VRTPLRRMGGWVAVLLVAGAVATCAKHPTGSIVLRLSTAHPAGGVAPGLTVRPESDSVVVAFGVDTLVIRQVALVVRDMEIAPSDAGDCEGTPDEHEEECPVLAEAPMVLGLPLGTEAGSALTVRVPPDAYSLLQFQIQTPDSVQDGELLAAHPEFGQGSIRLQGVYSRRGVRETVDYWVRFNEREELTIEPALTVARDSTATITLRVNVAKWFLNAQQNGMVDPGTAGPGQTYESLVRDNIRNSLKAFAASSTGP
jgi:hypothetical protein